MKKRNDVWPTVPNVQQIEAVITSSASNAAPGFLHPKHKLRICIWCFLLLATYFQFRNSFSTSSSGNFIFPNKDCQPRVLTFPTCAVCVYARVGQKDSHHPTFPKPHFASPWCCSHTVLFQLFPLQRQWASVRIKKVIYQIVIISDGKKLTSIATTKDS